MIQIKNYFISYDLDTLYEQLTIKASELGEIQFKNSILSESTLALIKEEFDAYAKTKLQNALKEEVE